MPTSGRERSFLFLQGPHGPFFAELGALMRDAGARLARVGFNAGDAAFWLDRESYIAFRGPPEDWPETLERLIAERAVTDIVLYGDVRPVHEAARAAATRHGLRLHCFEEGYLRPWWVTYERGGTNGHSRLMETDIAEMRAELASRDPEIGEAPARWGDLRQHVWYGARYHFHVMSRNRAYPHFRSHRELGVGQEFALYLRRLLAIPRHGLERWLATRRIKRGGFPYHLVLLQLPHDSSVQAHSPFRRMADFLDVVLDGFAEGAPPHHHLVFKGHPLDDGREALRRAALERVAAHGLAGRVHFVRGGKLADLLAEARSAVTINSTAAQQALWRGLPVKCFGAAVYAKPEFVSSQPIAEFFAQPMRPDTRAYRDFRRYLQETSQVQGSFYSALGRRRLLRRVADMVLAEHDPYEALHQANAAPGRPLRVVK